MERAIWPLFRRDWERSFFGVEAIQNSLTLNLFEKAFADLPKQSIGVYLQENQGWELGMIHSWRDNAHGELIGFPHATVRFWDLRYFFDQRSYCRSQVALPMPDFVAASGKSVKSIYLESGYPAKDLVEVEALRFLYLDKANNKQLLSTSFAGKRSKILILGITYLQTHIVR